MGYGGMFTTGIAIGGGSGATTVGSRRGLPDKSR